MKLLKHLLRSEPTPSEPEDVLGLFRVIEPRLEKASLDIFPRSALTLTRLGYAYRETGALGRAYMMYTRALQIQPLDTEHIWRRTPWAIGNLCITE